MKFEHSKKRKDLTLLIYVSGPSGSFMPALLSVENWVSLKPVLWGLRDVAHFHYPSCPDSVKPNLQFSCNFVEINISEGSLCFQTFNRKYIRFNEKNLNITILLGLLKVNSYCSYIKFGKIKIKISWAIFSIISYTFWLCLQSYLMECE
jgi:hypothetical protein